MLGVLLIAFLGIVLASLPIQRALFRALRERHPEIYARLGSPSMFHPATGGYVGFAFWRFLARREHRVLRDPSVSLMADTLLVLSASVIAIILVVFFGRAFLRGTA